MINLSVKNSICAACKRKGTLVARIVPMAAYPDHPDWEESFIECTACHAKTHAAYSNAELDAEARSVKTIYDVVLRGRAHLEYKRKFDAFQKVVLDVMFERLKLLFWKHLDAAERVRLLVQIGVLPDTALVPQTQLAERAALEFARSEKKLWRVWDAVMERLPLEEREVNPFL